MFIDELLQTYPDAKVVLSNRDIDSWVASMERSFYTILTWRTWPLIAFFDRVCKATLQPLHLLWSIGAYHY